MKFSRRDWLRVVGVGVPALCLSPKSTIGQEFSASPLAPPDAENDLHHPFWDRLRNEFLLEEGRLHFDTASFGISPLSTLETMQSATQEQSGTEREISQQAIRKVELSLARLLGAQKQEVLFSGSANLSMRLILGALAWQNGMRVLASRHADPETLRPLLELQARNSIELIWYDPTVGTRRFLQNIESQLQKNSLLLTHHVLPSNGMVMPLAALGAIAQRRKALLIVNGSEAAGLQDLTLRDLPIDFYFADANRYLLGPTGSGFLYANERILPRLRSYTRVQSGGRRWQVGVEQLHEVYTPTASAPLALALDHSLQWLGGLKVATARNRSLSLCQHLFDGVAGIPGVKIHTPTKSLERSPILTLQISGRNNKQVADWLLKELGMRVHQVDQSRYDGIRVSPYLVNRVPNVDWLIEAIRVLGA